MFIDELLSLNLSVEPPQLNWKFKEETLQPGPSVYLKCVAAGNPTPEIAWELDGARVTNSERSVLTLAIVHRPDLVCY